jgi:hypothetical protein
MSHLDRLLPAVDSKEHVNSQRDTQFGARHRASRDKRSPAKVPQPVQKTPGNPTGHTISNEPLAPKSEKTCPMAPDRPDNFCLEGKFWDCRRSFVLDKCVQIMYTNASSMWRCGENGPGFFSRMFSPPSSWSSRIRNTIRIRQKNSSVPDKKTQKCGRLIARVRS